MKGFMFSIEALSAAAIVILALGIFSYSTSLNEPIINNKEIQTQSQTEMTLYFNLPSITSTTTANEQYCKKIITYSNNTNTLIEKNYCKVVK